MVVAADGCDGVGPEPTRTSHPVSPKRSPGSPAAPAAGGPKATAGCPSRVEFRRAPRRPIFVKSAQFSSA
eukprot:1062517-Alexandrium_andersonii.AAC.1